MCANFQPIILAQAKLLTSQQLCFDFKDDVYPNYDAPLTTAIRNSKRLRTAMAISPIWLNPQMGKQH